MSLCGIWSGGDPRVASALARVSAGGTVLAEVHGGVGVAPRFRTHSSFSSDRVLVVCHADLLEQGGAERIAELYERTGEAFVEKLRGWFSLVLWDRRERQLVAAIDGFGIQRLVYHHDEAARRVVVASRIDALLEAGGIDRALNPRTVPNILNFTANLAPDTALANVRRLPPGHRLVASAAGVRVEPYWDLKYAPARGSEQSFSYRLEETVQDSVAVQMQRGGSIGAFLSGGTDSSTVVGMMSRIAGRGDAVKAFSIGFEEEAYNELEYAELAARSFGVRHFTYKVSADDCWNALPAILQSFDEPYANSSAIPTYFCAKLAASEGVTTMLAGDGGDELFGGNEHYRIDKIFHTYRSVPGLLRSGLIEPLLAIPVNLGPVERARSYVRRANLHGAERLLSFQFLATHPPREVFADGFLTALNGYEVRDTPNRHYFSAQAEDHLNRLLYVDAKIILGDNDLLKVTRMTGLAGVEPRFPFLGRNVVDFAATIPVDLKLKGLEKRYLFKRAFRNLLPQDILTKKKHGFGIPLSLWLKTDARLRGLLHDTLGAQRARERGYFRPGFVEGLLQQHQADSTSYYGDVLWTLLALELWHLQMVDAVSPEPVEAA